MYGPISSKIGTARKNKTGSWRVEKTPKFLQKDCIACKMCVMICPEACIAGGQKNTFVCDYSYCKGCGLCAMVCPKKDIEMVKEHL